MSNNTSSLRTSLNDVSSSLTDLTLELVKISSSTIKIPLTHEENEYFQEKLEEIGKQNAIIASITKAIFTEADYTSPKTQNRKHAAGQKSDVEVKIENHRTPHDYGFDYCLFKTLTCASGNLAISLPILQQVGLLYDSDRNPSSMTAKLQTWKTGVGRNEPYAKWTDSDKREITPAGRKKMDSIAVHLTPAKVERIKNAIKNVLHIDVCI